MHYTIKYNDKWHIFSTIVLTLILDKMQTNHCFFFFFWWLIWSIEIINIKKKKIEEGNEKICLYIQKTGECNYSFFYYRKRKWMSTNRILFVCTICLIENRDSQHVLTCIHYNTADEINISIIMTLTLIIFFF